MSDRSIENEYLYKLPPAILCEFNRIMDSLSDSDWERFASRVLRDQTDLRLAARRERRTDLVIQWWGERNGTVGDLLSLLEELQLLRARDTILRWYWTRHSPVEVTPPCKPFILTAVKGSPEDSQQTMSFPDPVPAPKPLPKPGPPPTGLTSKDRIEPPAVPQESHNAMCWSFEEVRQGTKNFSEALRIGEGGFGQVYCATMRNTEYAVKRLKQDSGLNWSLVKESFKTEVEKLSQYRHPNIVEFAGYSVGGGEHCLLYVFMPNGCLEDRLHCQSNAALSWSQRVSVLLGSAKAIQFLHSSNPPLIHGDVKSSNILLGQHLEPKLGDFGLARFYRSPGRTPGKTSTVAQTQTVRGTLAYLPDEYLKKGELGVEIDTYSFGVVLLEVLTGRRALETDSQSRTVFLKDLVTEDDDEESGSSASSVECLHSPAARRIWKKHLDPHISCAARTDPQGALQLATLACRCLDRRKKKRPPMPEVFSTLQDIHLSIQASRPDSFMTKDPHTFLRRSTAAASSSDFLLKSLDSVTDRFSKMGPQEDTYYCLANPSPSSSPSSLPPLKTLSSQGQPSAASGASWSPLPPFSQGPCESDDSRGYSQYFSSTLSSFSLPGRDSNRTSPSRCLGSHGAAVAGASSTSSQPDSSGEKIVVNAAKHRFVQKMALYEEGRISTSVLLSSEGSSCGGTYHQSQEPEESEFESTPEETSETNT
ncbi:hypothetical protein AGOR_G00139340 [Albula goreensis]|uniref:Protein kinase domain-containing protein n=1 Tax=Albula goreensis TaxID=1534307 RepID=A0A8T3DET8_9TELE|nr:hypothetical protein AGOR_G00139340 [Albula goreensis]